MKVGGVSLNNNPYYDMLTKLVSFVLIFILYLFELDSPGKYNNGLVYFSNALVVIYSLIHIISDKKRGFSSQKIFYLFIFFFMGIAPILQYKNGDETVGGYKILEQTYIYINFILLFIFIIFDIFYYYFSLKFKSKKVPFYIPKKSGNYSESKIWILSLIGLALFSTALTLYYFREAPLMLVFRGLEDFTSTDLMKQKDSSFSVLLILAFARPITFAVCLNYLCMGKNKYLKFIFIILALITNFPAGLARLRVAAYYLPLMLLLFKWVRKKNNFVFLFCFGLLLIFPFLNNFRTFSSGQSIGLGLDFEMFRSMNFDSYQSFAFVFQNEYITFGRQLLVVLFFWVPRSIWPDKPLMSGREVANEFDLSFGQISMNYFGEGYINFGLVGVVVFAIFLSYISCYFDYKFWRLLKGNIYNTFTPFYLFFIGMCFFFMRGDLMNGFSYTIFLLFANYVVYKVTRSFYK